MLVISLIKFKFSDSFLWMRWFCFIVYMRVDTTADGWTLDGHTHQICVGAINTVESVSWFLQRIQSSMLFQSEDFGELERHTTWRIYIGLFKLDAQRHWNSKLLQLTCFIEENFECLVLMIILSLETVDHSQGENVDSYVYTQGLN